MTTKRQQVSVPRARQVWERHLAKQNRERLATFSEPVRRAIENLEWVTHYGSVNAGWGTSLTGVLLQMRELARDAKGDDYNALLTRAKDLLAVFARDPQLTPVRDHSFYQLDEWLVHRYNALQRLVVALEKAVAV